MRTYRPSTPISAHGPSFTVRTSSIIRPEKKGIRSFALASHWSYGVLRGTTRLMVGPTFSSRSPSSLVRSLLVGFCCCCGEAAMTVKPAIVSAQTPASPIGQTHRPCRVCIAMLTGSSSLEHDLQPELDLTRRRRRVRDARRAGDPAAVRVEQTGAEVRGREIRAVQQVEHLGAELHVLLAEPRVLEHRQIDVLQIRSSERVAAREAVLAGRRQDERRRIVV